MVDLKKQRIYTLVSRLGSIGVIVSVFAFFATTMPNVWLSGYNLLNMLEQTVTLGLIVLGMTVIRAVGEMDLSVGAMLTLSSVLSMGLVVNAGMPPLVAIAISLLVGAVAGLLNGFLRTTARIPGVIPTIGSQGILTGAALVYSKGMAIYGSGPDVQAFTRIGRGIAPVAVLIAGTILVWWFLARTRYGRLVYMTGGNPEATRFSGARVNRVILSAYVICAVFAAAGGAMLSGRIGSGNPTAGGDFLLDCIIAVMIGSTVLTQEQEFTGLGSLIGALFMTVVNTGMQITKQGYPAQCLLRGILFLVCLFLFSLQRRATE
ncbi:MAG: ABC transporter permease [Bacillota bacterium]